MTALQIAQLIIILGPPALQLIQELTAVWQKESLAPEEVAEIVGRAKKSYDEYIAEARAALPA